MASVAPHVTEILNFKEYRKKFFETTPKLPTILKYVIAFKYCTLTVRNTGDILKNVKKNNT